MIRRLVVLILLLYGNILVANSQDLFNYENSFRYAKHLYAKGDYNDAITELNRCIFLSSEKGKIDVLGMLLTSYRKTGQYAEMLEASKSLYPEGNYPDAVKTEMHYSFILSNELHFGSHFLSNNHFSSPLQQVKFDVAYNVFENRYQEALNRLNQFNPANDEGKLFNQQVTVMLNEANSIRYKSPFIAGMFSAIIPGAGKFYANRKKDAIFSFVLTVAAAYQSYRAFNKNGIGSVVGWVYGGLASGFYIGNIYGSVQAAKKTNQFVNDKYHDQIRTVIGL